MCGNQNIMPSYTILTCYMSQCCSHAALSPQNLTHFPSTVFCVCMWCNVQFSNVLFILLLLCDGYCEVKSIINFQQNQKKKIFPENFMHSPIYENNSDETLFFRGISNFLLVNKYAIFSAYKSHGFLIVYLK